MTGLEIDHEVAFGSREYIVLLGAMLLARGMDLLSTWVATPTLALEGNPLARALGWRGGAAVSLVASLVLALLPIAGISVATASLLVASRNFQSAWLTRACGEHEYRAWVAARYRETRRGVFLVCLLLHTGLVGLVGAGLMLLGESRLIPFSIGLGIVIYALAVALFTGIGMGRAARRDNDERAQALAPTDHD